MANKRRIILYELNEVSWELLDGFCRRFPGSTLATVLPASEQIESISPEARLSPWITWPTVHRGVPDTVHGSRHQGQPTDAVDAAHPPVWRALADHGVSVGVFGSLHSYPAPVGAENYAFYVPDVFADSPECIPDWVTPFQALNLEMTRESGRNVSTSLPVLDGVKVLLGARRLGLRLSTLIGTGLQLATERVRPWRKTRRRSVQGMWAADVFLRLLASERPQFATFFTNHVASSLHRYWAAAFPDQYASNEYDDAWIARYHGEIDFTLRLADDILERLVRFTDRNPDYQIWIVSSMGQAATVARPIHTQLLVIDLPQFMAAMGVPPGKWVARSSMVPDWSVIVDAAVEKPFVDTLATVRVDGQPIEYGAVGNGFVSFSFGQADLEDASVGLEVNGAPQDLAEAGLANVAIDDEAGSAHHIPNGVWAIYDPQDSTAKSARPQQPTTDIMPRILANFGI
jgi:hypothetical protein